LTVSDLPLSLPTEEARVPVAYIPKQARIEVDSDWQLVAAGLD
jgi:hypothetical protein